MSGSSAGTIFVGNELGDTGPTHLVADRHGHLIATDTHGDKVRVFEVFGALPAPREIGKVPQPGGPYGIAYDPVRDLVWVASSGINQVVGYHMIGPMPQETLRIPTMQNPYSLGVDPATGRRFVACVSTRVVQIIDPGATGG